MVQEYYKMCSLSISAQLTSNVTQLAEGEIFYDNDPEIMLKLHGGLTTHLQTTYYSKRYSTLIVYSCS